MLRFKYIHITHVYMYLFTSAPTVAATDPPPGAGVRAATPLTNPATLPRPSSPNPRSLLPPSHKQYSMMRSLYKITILT